MLPLIDICHATPEARGNLCACLAPSALGRLRSVAGDQRLEPGSLVFTAGTPADCVFGLRQGVVMLVRALADGRRQVLSFHFPGDTFGFADAVHADAAVALTRVSLCRIPLAALEADPALAATMRGIAGRSLAAALDHALLLGRLTARERVAAFVIDLWRRTGQPAEIHLAMRTADIADHIGLRPETVSRFMAEFRRAGWLGPLVDGWTEVAEPASLASLIGQG